MADDERKTLLRFEGDASSVKQAARETREAIEQVASTQEGGAAKADQSAKGVTDSLKKQEDGAVDTSKAFDTFASSLGTTAQEAAAAKQMIGRVSPELSRGF